MKNWFDVIPPHEDIRKGHFDEAIFAAGLVIADVPAGKIADVNRGILMPIKAAFGNFTFTLEMQVSDPEGISQTALENTIKETIRQIGARVVDEMLE
jgi:hypothetical protein